MGRGSKNYQEVKRGAKTNSAFAHRGGGGDIGWGALHNNIPFEAHFPAHPS